MVFVVSEVYYPEEAGTAHYMTGIAEGLARRTAVKVICAKPKYDGKWHDLPGREIRSGVEIRRCWATTFDKNWLPGRIANVITASLSIFTGVLRSVRKGDTVLVVTSPPSLPVFTALACLLRGARCFLRVDDVYPEAMIHAGIIRAGGFAARLINVANRALCRRADLIVVLGRDMQHLVEKRFNGPSEKIIVVPNWADMDILAPAPRAVNKLLRHYGLEDKFVVGYAGNIGRVQAVEALFEAACLLKSVLDVHFVFVGSGQKSAWLKSSVEGAGLRNVTLTGVRPRSEQPDFLNACDLGIVSLVRGMAGAGVPSRLYNVMAVGKPILAVVDEDSEVAMVVREERLGWVVPPDEPERIAAAILEARSNKERLAEMGTRARRVAETKYSRERILAVYESLMGGSASAAGYAV